MSLEVPSETMELEVEVIGGILECSIDAKTLWSLPIAAIVLIAEYSTKEGYWGDDGYLLLFSIEDGKPVQHRVPDVVIGGLGTLLNALQPHFSTTLGFQLPFSEWGSRVIWPEEIKNEKLYTLDPVASVGVLEKLKERFLDQPLSLELTQPVREYLQQFEALPMKSASRTVRP